MDDNRKASLLLTDGFMGTILSLLFACLGLLAERYGGRDIYLVIVTVILFAAYAFMAYQGVLMVPLQARRTMGPLVVAIISIIAGLASLEVWTS